VATIVETLENVLAFRVTGLAQSSQQIDRFFSQLQAQSRRRQQLTDFGTTAGAGAAGNVEAVTGNLDRIQKAERLLGPAALAGAVGIGVLINKAAGMEQIQIAFEGLLGSAGAARVELDKLRDFANHSPFNFEQVAQGSQMLLAAGASADQLIPILTALGNANARSGRGQEAYNRSLLATSQILSKGRLQGEELLQLQEAGVPLNAVLKELGVSYQDVGTGAVTAARFTQALIKVMTTGDFAGAMEKQGKTLNGTFSTLQDSIGQLETSMGQGLAPAAVTVVKALTAVVDAANSLGEPAKRTAGVVGGVLVAGAIVAWGWLKALELQNIRLMNSMLRTAGAATAEAAALQRLGGAAGAASAGTAAAGGAGAGGAAAAGGKGLGFLGNLLAGGWLSGLTPKLAPGDFDKNMGRLKALFGPSAGKAPAAAAAQTPDQKMIELLQKQLDEAKKQSGMMASASSASVSTSEVALYRQMAGRRAVQYTR
jgi:tape measure domain-containing protein